MAPEAIHTANLILFLDKLFDSLNSSRKTGPPGKPLKGAVTTTSDHISFWYKAIEIIETMKFWDPVKRTFVVVPSLKNLIFTIRGFIVLSQKILRMFSNKYIAIRVFQQDGLENLFGCVRNYSGRETSPNAHHLQTSFKALIVNNFFSLHSPGANCEDDKHEGPLDNLRCFLTGEVIAGIAPIEDSSVIVEPPQNIPIFRKSKIARCTATYISGFVAKKMLRKVSSCSACKKNLFFRDNNNDLDFIEARQYNRSKLAIPGTFLNFLVTNVLTRLFYVLPRICHVKNLSVVLQHILLKEFKFNVINCPQHHGNGKLLAKIIVNCAIFFGANGLI